MNDAPFLSRLTQLLEHLATTQGPVFDQVAGHMADTLANDGLVHLFGSGHSVLPTQEAFPRYGSFVGLNPLNDPRLMWHNILGPGGVRELLWLERTEGYIEKFLAHEPLRAGDMLVVYSHGGRNAAPVEAALYAKKKGLWVVAVTSAATQDLPRPHSSGLHIAEIADATIDTGAPIEDAVVTVSGWDRPTAGVSTTLAFACTQELIARTSLVLAGRGVTLPTFVSPTVPGASVESNDQVFGAYQQLMAEVRAAWAADQNATEASGGVRS